MGLSAVLSAWRRQVGVEVLTPSTQATKALIGLVCDSILTRSGLKNLKIRAVRQSSTHDTTRKLHTGEVENYLNQLTDAMMDTLKRHMSAAVEGATLWDVAGEK